ncbi:AEC family transporter [Candidatus Stoquefichus sp. SB1]|uniref:AEC family transporter n=1 Tax=Candidatus Stoquefichus sp. SB1 TaxID=1658109 RepID=UPI00067EB59E|nr:AEC family transporter [Candidatus Stoquefichus sp. SB1]
MDIQVILMQMIQLFLVIALGYFLFKVKILDVDLNKKLTTLLLTVTTPAMIVSSVLSTTVTQSFNDILFVFLIGFAIYLIMPILGFIIVKVMKIPLPQQGLYIFMTVFSNIGFMGFPVMKAIFGNEAVFFTAIFNMIFNLFVFTAGIVIMNYGTGQNVKLDPKNLLSPGVIASLVALLIYFTGIHFPDVISSTVTMVGDITTPMAMLLIGSTLANIPLKEVFTELKIYPYTIIKQIIVPVIAYPILKLIIGDPLILGITLIMISMPVANSAVLFATEYDGDVSLAAKTVFMTTLLSVVTIPLIVALFLV